MKPRKRTQLSTPLCNPQLWISLCSDNAISLQSLPPPPPPVPYTGTGKRLSALTTAPVSTEAAVPNHQNPIQRLSMATCVKTVYITPREQGPSHHRHQHHRHQHLHYVPLTRKKLRRMLFPPHPHRSPVYTPETGVGKAKPVSSVLCQTRV